MAENNTQELSFYLSEDSESDPTTAEGQLNAEFKECRKLWKKIKRSSCKVKNKADYVKEIAKRTAGGGIQFENGKIQASIPEFRVFKSELDKLNLVIATFHNEQLRWCNQSRECDVVEYLSFCYEMQGKTVPTNTQRAFNECRIIFTGNSTDKLITSISKMGAALSEFNSGKLNEEAVKAIMDGELLKLEPDDNSMDSRNGDSTSVTTDS